MSLSQVQVVNLCLTKLGQDRVISLNDDIEAARVVRAVWDMTVDTVLAAHPWKFAILRDELAASVTVPAGTQWTVQYALPDACLRVVQVGEDYAWYTGDAETFALEGGNILTNEEAPLFVRYVQRVSNTGLWPPLFARALAMQLAADCAKKLTGSNTDADNAAVAYEMAVREAKRQNAIERPPQRFNQSDWLASRGD